MAKMSPNCDSCLTKLKEAGANLVWLLSVAPPQTGTLDLANSLIIITSLIIIIVLPLICTHDANDPGVRERETVG